MHGTETEERESVRERERLANLMVACGLGKDTLSCLPA